jgi:hypothetical protein
LALLNQTVIEREAGQMLQNSSMANLGRRWSRPHFWLRFLSTFVLLLAAPAALLAQQPAEVPTKQTNPAVQANLPNAPSSILTGKPHRQGQIPLELVPHPKVTLRELPLNIAGDMYRVVTSPLYLRGRDLLWLVPLAGATAASFSQDTHVSHDVVSHNVSFNATAGSVSDDVRDSFIAGPIALYGIGSLTHNARATEAGQLAGEAMTTAYITDALIKLGSFRERPNVDHSNGNFYQTAAGVDSSFISGHAIISWSSAAVLAAEYPKPWQQVGLYTAATAVSLDRVLAEQHFPTDVLLGSAVGWLIGHYVVRAHHHEPIFRRKAQADTVTAP